MIHIGFEVKTGVPVSIPLHHTVVSAITRTGKSVTIEALVDRCDSRFLIFDVKDPRDYEGFDADTPLYLRDRTEPLMLKRLLESSSRLWLRREFPELIEVCKEGQTYQEVLSKIREKLSTKIHPVVKQRLEVLEHLMMRLIDEMTHLTFTKELVLNKKVSVMNLSKAPRDIQQLVVDSTLKEVLEKEENIVVVLDEIHRFIPQRAPSAARDAVTTLIREGAAKNIFLWMVDQTLTGIDKDAIKEAWVWILGRQMEINEAKRTLDQIPTKSNLTTKDIMQLKVGHFLVCSSDFVKQIYVQPIWLGDDDARMVALGKVDVEEVNRSKESDVVKLKKEAERLRETVKRQREEIVRLKSALKSSRLVSDVITGKAAPSEDVYRLIDGLKKQIDELRGKQVVLPPQLKMLSEDEKKVWLFLRRRGKAFKIDVRGYTGWGRRRVNKILNNLEKRRLIGRTGRKIFAKEPMV